MADEAWRRTGGTRHTPSPTSKTGGEERGKREREKRGEERRGQRRKGTNESKTGCGSHHAKDRDEGKERQ